ncbi:MAG: hypothetical protein CMI55_02070 [Parcubacteria group bacterium]|jgi:hypothetical protein|nr:hypothetical protein [Parcubacteria group bacterium]|tara:strand:+ start:3089 stop:3658 length:570 start_codon:yes stop_codon:yes gene_type:complete
MNLDLFIQTLYLFLFCLWLAAFEIQIEGKHGWAARLPTWRANPDKWYAKIYRKMMGGKELTGYHLLVFSSVLIFLHHPYFAGQGWSWFSELGTLSFFFLISITWDFLWFVINPHYGVWRFTSEYIGWHKKWFLFMPISYYYALAISALLYLRFSLNLALFKEWLAIIGLFSVLTLMVVILIFIFPKEKI